MIGKLGIIVGPSLALVEASSYSWDPIALEVVHLVFSQARSHHRALGLVVLDCTNPVRSTAAATSLVY